MVDRLTPSPWSTLTIHQPDLRRQSLLLRPDPARVILRAFLPTAEPSNIHKHDPSRIERITARILALDEEWVESELADIEREFGDRHPDLRAVFAERFEQAWRLMPMAPMVPDEARRLLIGAYFSHEYSFEAAALFNPSMVLHPDQTGLSAGEARFVLSLRATGEGHISSICFRSGVVDAAGVVALDLPEPLATTPAVVGSELAEGGFEVVFPDRATLAERVLFPITARQRNGLEDARFVRFTEDDGRVAYYATYTAYSGREITPELLRTEDFRRFAFLPTRGEAVRNKGLALFPRRVGGHYVMLTRLDGETLQLSRSDDLRVWRDATPLLGPCEPWEFLQVGNCGSPIEITEGWLVLTHGVGSMRRYSIGAVLLDRDDPTRILARLREPLLSADARERVGYVPNVVYSCGGMVHGDNLILPYAASDSTTTFAAVGLRSLMAAMR